MGDSVAVVPVTWRAMPGIEGAEQGRGKTLQHDFALEQVAQVGINPKSDRSTESAERVKGRTQEPQERHRPAVWAC